MTLQTDTPWFVRHRKAAMIEERLFCFPYAGGNAQLFHGWRNKLPSSVELVAVQAPGKGVRLLETPCGDIDELCESLIEALMPFLNDKPFSFFGHSNGAFVSFELACRMKQKGLPLPQQLFLSASAAPWTRDFTVSYSQMTDEEFKDSLKSMEASVPGILDDAALFELMLPGLRADFSLAEDYEDRWTNKLDVKTHVFYGEDDEITEQQIFAWQNRIQDKVTFEKFKAGHFFIHSHEDELTQSVGCHLLGHSHYTMVAKSQLHLDEHGQTAHQGTPSSRHIKAI